MFWSRKEITSYNLLQYIFYTQLTGPFGIWQWEYHIFHALHMLTSQEEKET